MADVPHDASAGSRHQDRPGRPVPDPSPHVEVHPGDGPPLVLLHGIMAGRALWTANLDRLRTVCTPIVVELFGHGRSPAPQEPDRYALDAYVDVLERVRRRLLIERWLLFGHSLGAALSLRYALAHPERVIGHAFSNSASALADDSWRSRVRATVDDDAGRIELGGPAALVAHRLNPVNSRHLVPRVHEALALDCALLEPAGVAATMRGAARAGSLREQISSNRAPCLLIAGEREAGFEEPARHAAAVMPQLTTIRLDAGHSPNAESPRRFDAVLSRFIRSLS